MKQRVLSVLLVVTLIMSMAPTVLAVETAEQNNEANSYRWDFTDNLVAYDQYGNKANSFEETALAGDYVIKNGLMYAKNLWSGVQLKLENPIELKHDKNWSIEWKVAQYGTTSSYLFSSHEKANGNAKEWLIAFHRSYAQFSSFLNPSTFYNYGAHKLAGSPLDGHDGDVLLIINNYDEETGKNTISLYKNSELLVEDFSTSGHNNGKREYTAAEWAKERISGTDFVFKYLGAQKGTGIATRMMTSKLDYIEVKLDGAHVGDHSYEYTSNEDGTHNGVCACGDTIVNENCTYGSDTICDMCGYENVTKIVWLNPDEASAQSGLTYNAAAKMYVGGTSDSSTKDGVLYTTTDALALPLEEGAKWSLNIGLASYISGQIIAHNPDDIYSRIYLGTSSSTSGRKDVRLGFTFDYTDVSNSTGTKYYNFTWNGIKENIWDGNAHTLQLNYSDGKFTLIVDDTSTYTINSIVVGNNAEILVDDTDGRISQVVVDLIRSQTGSDYLVFNGGGNPSPSLGFKGAFSGITATIEGAGYDSAPAPVLEGKNVHFLGSSIFNGGYGSGQVTSFVDVLARKWNVTTFQKQTVSGTTLAVRENTDANKPSYCEQYESFTDKDKCDALIIQLSTNDFNEGNGTNTPVGTVTSNEFDVTTFDKTTICGAIEWIIATAKTNNPDVKVVFVSTPMLATWNYYDEYKNFASNQMNQIVDKWEIDFVDCTSYTHPWASSNTYWQATTTAPSSSTYHLFYNEIHPNNVGHSLLMAPPVAAKLIEILGN